jgi:hypothetical protein
VRAFTFGRHLSTLCLFLTSFATDSASALGTPEQRKACTPDVYCLGAGEIPNARAITPAAEEEPIRAWRAARTGDFLKSVKLAAASRLSERS